MDSSPSAPSPNPSEEVLNEVVDEVYTQHNETTDDDRAIRSVTPSQSISVAPAVVHSANASPSPSDIANHSLLPTEEQIECPATYVSTVEYNPYDIVSSSIGGAWSIYQCKKWPQSAYCNSFEPGRDNSDFGWTMIAPCVIAPTANTTEESTTPTPSPSHASANTMQPSIEVGDESLLTPLPTATATLHSDHYTTWLANPDEAQDAVLVKLPRIICDLTFSSSLAQSFEQKHVLLVAMSSTIYSVLGKHLRKDLHDIAGISLVVSVSKTDPGTGSTMRLKATFIGSVSFSLRGAPTERDLVNILLRYFSVEEFTSKLKLPLRVRNVLPESVLKVNSVFFSLDDGSLIQVGAPNYTEQALPATSGIGRDKAGYKLQISLVFFALLAMAFGLVMMMLLVQVSRTFRDDDESSDSLGDMAPSVGQSITAVRADSLSEPTVEITVSATPNFRRGGHVLDDISEVSSLSASPYTERASHYNDIAPETPSLGISAPNRRYSGVPVPYACDGSHGFVGGIMLETP